MWLSKRYILFKLSVKMCTSCVGLCMLARAKPCSIEPNVEYVLESW